MIPEYIRMWLYQATKRPKNGVEIVNFVMGWTIILLLVIGCTAFLLLMTDLMYMFIKEVSK